MKKFTSLKGILIVMLFVASSAGNLPAQSLSASPQNILKPIAPNSVPVTLTPSGFGGSGNYAWTVSPNSTGITGFSASTTSGTPAQTVSFTSSAGAGTYTFTVNRSGVSRTVDVTLCNLLASAAPDSTDGNRGQWVGGFLVNAGVLAANANGQQNFFDFGLSNRVSAIAVNQAGFIYYLENVSINAGSVTVSASNSSGTTINSNVATLDLNGGSNTNLGFVRLGIDATGVGWILAGSGTVLYLAKFTSNGTAATSITLVSSNVPITGGGTAADFQNGDLCLAGNGNMLALANDGAGLTEIFTMNPNAVTPTLTKKFQVNGSGPAPFTGTVNGAAFDISGNLYMSSNSTTGISGLYYIPQSTVNTGTGTVNSSLVWTGDGLTDLGSNFWPNTIILPVRFESFTADRQGNNAVLNWVTATETDADHYEIERSLDGVNFNSAGTVRAAGTTNSNRNYQYTDPITTTARIIYYRLGIVDANGKTSYSKIVALRLNGMAVKNFTVYPNPFTSDLKLDINTVSETNITIRINNAAGQLAFERKVTLQPGENVVVLNNLEALKPGMHLMEIITEDGKLIQKIIKR